MEKAARNMLRDFFIPYLGARKQTLALSKILKEIPDGESPFARHDARKLLEKFHYGIVDNEGSIVLLRHPSMSKKAGWRRLVEWLAWKQPFQRTRFEINKPPVKEKKKFRFPNLRMLKPRLALAAVNF